MRNRMTLISLIMMAFSSASFSNEQDHHDEEGVIALTPQQRLNAGVTVAPVVIAPVTKAMVVPGEVKANGYSSYLVSPRMDAVIVERHVTLGMHVKVGDPLVTLFSPTLAQAQADYQLARSNYERLKKLSNKSVSSSEVESALIVFNRATATLSALGVSATDITELASSQARELGLLTLYANAAGVVLNDDFQQGQGVAVGEAIMQISDEQTVWVEASLTASQQLDLTRVTSIDVLVDSTQETRRYRAELIQTGHTIDEQTRTRTLRLNVVNTDHQLHSGMFVSAAFNYLQAQTGTQLPQSALVNDDGNWLVFAEIDAGEFKPIAVNVLADLGDSVYVSGLSQSMQVVTQGAFFIASEAKKANFDAHNH